jgi:arylsulfatase A-like enzyme
LNKFVTSYLRGAWLGLAAATGWFAAESAWLVATEPPVAWWSAPFNLGVAAPLAAASAILAGIVFVAWGRLLGTDNPVEEVLGSVHQWLVGGSRQRRARRSAWLVTVAASGGLWLWLGLLAGPVLLERITTMSFALIVLIGFQLATAVALWFASALMVLPVEAVFARLGSLHAALATPAAACGVLASFGAAALIYLFVAVPDVMNHLPWGVALSAVSAVVSTGLAHAALVAFSRPARLVVPAAIIVGALGVFSVALPHSLSQARNIWVGQSTVTGVFYAHVHEHLDYDGDGAIHLYGDNDCAPRDSDIGPHAREIIADDIDQNCSGFDLVVELDDFDGGPTAHPRPTGIAERPHVILVTTDALSYDHTTLGGYSRDTTPKLADWAERATVFEAAFALGPGTRLALPGLLASRFNSMIPMANARAHPYGWKASMPTLPVLLRKRGYRAVFVPGDKYFTDKRWRGFARGFDVVDPKANREADDPVHSAAELTDAAIDQLDSGEEGEPLFLWVHYFDHHSPHKIPDGHQVFEGGVDGYDRAVERYDNEVHFADSHWGRLFSAIEDAFEPEDYLVIFSSDHGSIFKGDRPGKHRHGYMLDTRTLHVPLIVQGPKQRGRRVDGLVSHADVLPTLASVVGIEPDDEWIGESLVPVLFDGESVQKDAVFSLFYIPEAVKRGEDGFEKAGVRTDRYAYWEDMTRGDRKLVDWRADPAEKHDLHDELPDTFEAYRYVTATKLEWLRERERGLTKYAKKKKKKKAKSKKKGKAKKKVEKK